MARAFLDGESLPEAGPRDVPFTAATPSRLAAPRGDMSSVPHWACADGVALSQCQGGAAPPASP